VPSNLPLDSTPETPISADIVVPGVDADKRQLLQGARTALANAGFYSYVMLDENQRWCVAADDEAGRVDVRLDSGQYIVDVCGSSPGLFMEEDSEWRRQALERLARRVVPNVAQGMLGAHQSAHWNEDDSGVAVCITHGIPFDQPEGIPVTARRSLLELDDLLTLVESQLRS